MRRVTRPDTYVPCNFANQLEILPSLRRVLWAAADLLDLDLSWQLPKAPTDDLLVVEAIGSGPADETVEVVEWLIEPGANVRRGDPLVSLEATKSVFELTSPAAGVVEELLVLEGESIAVGDPLLRIRPAATTKRTRGSGAVAQGTPRFSRRPARERLRVPRRDDAPRQFEVGISTVSTVTGSREVSNAELLAGTRDMTPEDVVRRTGIVSRHWATGDENAVNMAVRACWDVLDREQLIVDDIDLVICSTTSPTVVTPSMACQVMGGLAAGKKNTMAQAYDINAACSGYLYALQAGFDYLQSTPHGRVLVVTSEVLSPLLDPHDLDTAILFGDAASASVLYGEGHIARATGRLHRPDLSARAEDESTLSVPLLHDGYIQMKGRRVFSEAVRAMIASLTRACASGGMGVADLNLVVPHQANQRIIDAIASRIGVSVYSNIRTYGNTSSTSIPLCLSDVLPSAQKGNRLGLCAFGGGFTFGAGILEVL
jgi:2-oxoisovalerate dehydrogenase E1 component